MKKLLNTLCITLFVMAAPLVANANGGKGMTWGKSSHDNTLGIDQVNCTTTSATCNAYFGDTSCALSRPVLCLKVDNSARPNYVASGGEFYDGWAKGHITTTMPIQGTALTSATSGDQLCQATFGAGWRMAEFHDNRVGGWAFRAYGNIRSDQRVWVRINDQPANCWNP